MLRHLPLALITSVGVLVLPAALAGALLTPRGAPEVAGAAVLACVLSALLTSCLADAYKHYRGASDVVFSELLPWGFARRCYAELRLRDVHAAYDLAAQRNELVRIEQLEGLARLQAIRAPYTHGHSHRVAGHAERIARAMHLSPAGVAKVRTAALIHDVGKVYTPRAILNKPGKLTDAEFEIVKLHATDGAELVSAARDPELAEIVRHHHERLDGSGYPDGLVGGSIPIGARIVAVADTFDAVTSDRPYRRARSQRDGLALLREERGIRLDAAAVDAFAAGCLPRRSVLSAAGMSAGLARLASALNLWPALAAAGLVALSPVTPIRPRPYGPVRAPAATAGHGYRPQTRARASQPRVAGSRAHGAPSHRALPVRHRAGRPHSWHTVGAIPPAGQTGPAGSSGVSHGTGDQAPTAQPPPETPSSVPPITVPPVNVPPAEAPPAAVPPVATPPVTAPTVTVPTVTTPVPVPVHVP